MRSDPTVAQSAPPLPRSLSLSLSLSLTTDKTVPHCPMSYWPILPHQPDRNKIIKDNIYHRQVAGGGDCSGRGQRTMENYLFCPLLLVLLVVSEQKKINCEEN